MEVLPVFERPLTIQSHRGPYTVSFEKNLDPILRRWLNEDSHFLVDAKVAEMHGTVLRPLLESKKLLKIPATEENKSLEKMPAYVSALVENQVRRNQKLIAIGGGILQDITCFLAATLLRGLPWSFLPTTLLAQADSCIGSKSSINSGEVKNILGTFTPPSEVFIDTQFLDTLSDTEIRSGIGEMLKVHLLNGPASFRAIAEDFHALHTDKGTLNRYLLRSLEIKKAFIEGDEFDKGIRNLLNYGHSFGHAVETATQFKIPHGIAVTMGMDMANYVSLRMGRLDNDSYLKTHFLLRKNYRGFETHPIPIESFFSALKKDKKNTVTHLALILWDGKMKLAKTLVEDDLFFETSCVDFLAKQRIS